MDLEKLRHKEYKKCTSLLGEMIGLDSDTRERIYKCFQSVGIKIFFLHTGLLDLPQDVSEKLKSIKAIIDICEEERGASIT